MVDGFHRQLLGREAGTGKRLKGWLPVACINTERKGQATRMAATIRPVSYTHLDVYKRQG